MGANVSTAVTIDRPADEVFDFIVNYHENGLRWATDVESVTKATDGPVVSGTSFDQVQLVMGKRRNTRLTFVEVTPPHTIRAEADLGPIRPTMTLSVESIGDRSRVVAEGRANPRGFFKLLSPVAGRKGTQMWTTRLANLKSVLEAS